MRGVRLGLLVSAGLLGWGSGVAGAASVALCVPAGANAAVVTPGGGGSCAAGATKVALPASATDQQTLLSVLPHMKYAAAGVGGKPTITFTGVNAQIVSGSGSTNGAVNGRGNLVIGYDESLAGAARSGSHNLILGSGQGYSSYGSILGGAHNTSSDHNALLGGYNNTVSGAYGAVTGGRAGSALGDGAQVAGGFGSTAGGPYSTVSGGAYNTAAAQWGSVSGGGCNIAGPGAPVDNIECHSNAIDARFAAVTGGVNNIAKGRGASVTSGDSNTASAHAAAVTGGDGNISSGFDSSVTGGFFGEAGGQYSAVLGGMEELVSTSFGTFPAGP